MSRTPYTVTVCVLLRRGEHWLLTVRGPAAAYAPGQIGLVGGHLEVADGPLGAPGALEAAARRETREETGLDLGGVPLTYLESELIDDGGPRPQLTVTFGAHCPAEAEPTLAAPDELSQVGWWTVAELRTDPRCPSWLSDLLGRHAP